MRIPSKIGLVAIALLGVAESSFADVNVYSSRKEHLIKPVFAAFEKDTGIKVKYLTDKDQALVERIKAEGKSPRADMLITVDAGNLWHAASQGILDSVDSKKLTANIPSHLRDPQGRWFGLSVRARTIVYSTARLDPKELSTYEGSGRQ